MEERLTYFSIIRYVPDPIREEQVNIGIIVVTDDGSFAQACFLQDWRRAQRFGGEDIRFLKDFVKEIDSKLAEPYSLFEDKVWNPKLLSDLAANWQNSIQFSAPKLSLLPAEEVLENNFHRYIVELPEKAPVSKERRRAISSARSALENQLQERFKRADIGALLLKKSELIDGQYGPHQFELAIKNGQPYLAAKAISFTLKDSENKGILREIDAAAGAIADVREKSKQLQLAVLLTPPNNEIAQELYETTKNRFIHLEAKVVEKDNLEDWAADVVNKLPEEILS